MIAPDIQAKGILRRAAAIVREGWSHKAPARNEMGNPVVATAHVPPNIQRGERPLAPVYFDVGSAIWRAAAQPAQGKSGQEGKLGYWAVRSQRQTALDLAIAKFCRAAKTMHPSIWNDEVCKSGEQAAAMLEAAAEAIA